MKALSNILAITILFFITACSSDPANSKDGNRATKPCTAGMANQKYACNNIDLVAHLSVSALMGEAANDIWGWTDPQTGIEYALVGLTDGVTIVDISDPEGPVVMAKLEETASISAKSSHPVQSHRLYHDEHEGKSSWRDFKVSKNHLFVVSDAQPHGLQIFDLTQLRDISNPPEVFTEDVLYDDFANAHNIAINEETGYAYIVGSNTYGGGLHIVDINDPLQPNFVGFHSDSTVGLESTGYVHDTQCVSYKGPDVDYRGEEICMNSSETHLVIANATDKSNVETISATTYAGNAYAHQGWLTEDHRYFLLDDEFDELNTGEPTKTYIWDIRDLDDPQMIGTHQSTESSIDHNQYVRGNLLYQSNYTTGLRILSLDDIENGQLREVAYFDTFPAHNNAEFDGAWSNYPYFESGVIIVSDVSNGLFILQPQID